MFDWHQFHLSECDSPAVVDPRRRLRVCLLGFAGLALVVLGRAVQLEVTEGEAFREEAGRLLQRQHSLPGVRGRILACDGTVLACDQQVVAVAVHYRYLQEPPDDRWLRAAVRARLPKADRKDPAKLAAAEANVRAERDELAVRLAGLCGQSASQWHARARQVQARVQRIAAAANARARNAAAMHNRAEEPADASDSVAAQLGRRLFELLQSSVDQPQPPRLTVAEELDYHVMAEDVPPGVVAQIEGNPSQYPGVKVLTRARRVYPAGTLAAHVLGHLGPVDPQQLDPHGDDDAYRSDDRVGRAGVERQYEAVLRGRRGVLVEMTDHSGRVQWAVCQREPGTGRDLVLTLDARLQRAAEDLLDSARQRRAVQSPDAEPAGGAIVVMDVASGALKAAASAPRFDPNWFVAGEAEQLAALHAERAAPLFDRVCRMALPPGSVFKTLSAVALLESAAAEAQEPFYCQGYLHRPEQQRCEIYLRQGIGHGEVTLADALCVSCNVYFFDRAGRLGPRPLLDWAERFGFGRPTGVDLPGEVAGVLPTPEGVRTAAGRPWQTADTQLLAIGQGPLTVTPLQVACMMAAVANGGRLVTPHVLDDQTPPVRSISGLHPQTLETLREGLRRVVADAQGTANATMATDEVGIAGKTGTAETGDGRGSHAWLAGYVPAERPRFAIVVVLEHAGSGSTAAGPVAKRLVLHMQQLGML